MSTKLPAHSQATSADSRFHIYLPRNTDPSEWLDECLARMRYSTLRTIKDSGRDSRHRDTNLLVNPLSLYWLHIWWGTDRMYLRMGSVFQGHKELEGPLPRPNGDAERITLPPCLAN